MAWVNITSYRNDGCDYLSIPRNRPQHSIDKSKKNENRLLSSQKTTHASPSTDLNEILHAPRQLTLSWRVQNFVVIGRVHCKPGHFKFWCNFEFDRDIVSETGAWRFYCLFPNTFLWNTRFFLFRSTFESKYIILSQLVSIGSDDGLMLNRLQAIITPTTRLFVPQCVSGLYERHIIVPIYWP